MRVLVDTGASVTVVAVTDGEASHPGSPVARGDLARVRRREAAEAQRRLGLAAPVVHLGLPDGGVARHEEAVARALHDVLDEDAICVTPWRHDGHPDHDATGRASAVAARRRGARHLEYPVWAWHWAVPAGDPARDLPWAGGRRQDLPLTVQRAKGRAIDAFASQIAPLGDDPNGLVVLPAPVLARFRRPFEVFFETADGDW